MDPHMLDTQLYSAIQRGDVDETFWLLSEGGATPKHPGGQWKHYMLEPPLLTNPVSTPEAWLDCLELVYESGGGAPHGGFQLPQTREGLPDIEAVLQGAPVIKGDLGRWRASNPHALVANLAGREDLTDSDLVHVEGVFVVCLMGNGLLTDKAFSHLGNAHTLVLALLPGITDAAFAFTPTLHTLVIGQCSITSRAFREHLTGLHTLDMDGCQGVDDEAFLSLPGLYNLSLRQCARISGCYFEALGGIDRIEINGVTVYYAGRRESRAHLVLDVGGGQASPSHPSSPYGGSGGGGGGGGGGPVPHPQLSSALQGAIHTTHSVLEEVEVKFDEMERELGVPPSHSPHSSSSAASSPRHKILDAIDSPRLKPEVDTISGTSLHTPLASPHEDVVPVTQPQHHHQGQPQHQLQQQPQQRSPQHPSPQRHSLDHTELHVHGEVVQPQQHQQQDYQEQQHQHNPPSLHHHEYFHHSLPPPSSHPPNYEAAHPSASTLRTSHWGVASGHPHSLLSSTLPSSPFSALSPFAVHALKDELDESKRVIGKLSARVETLSHVLAEKTKVRYVPKPLLPQPTPGERVAARVEETVKLSRKAVLDGWMKKLQELTRED